MRKGGNCDRENRKVKRIWKQKSQLSSGLDSNDDHDNGLPPYKGGHDDYHIGVWRRGDSAFEVKNPGLYLLNLREQEIFPSRSGPNTFEWAFIKDSSSDDGQDSAWIDDILFP